MRKNERKSEKNERKEKKKMCVAKERKKRPE